jgi:general secretion pathway protein A
MYYQYFGLNEAPFSIAVNPRYLFMSTRHRDALAHLLYGVGSGGGFILLTGEVGTGKTTINRCLLEQLPDDTDIAIILNPALNALELLASACDELDIHYDPDNHSLKILTDKLQEFLLANHGRGRKTVLMIDEAQHLDFEVLEQIRLLTNLETDSEKLLQIILIGQPELAQLLARPELRQLNQRITARYNLEALNLHETGAYIRHRLQVAGLPADRILFPTAVVKGVYQRSRGIPRLINLLCDRMLLGAYGRNQTCTDKQLLSLACKEVMGEQPAAKGGRALSALAVASAIVLLAGVAFWWREANTGAAAPVLAAAAPAIKPAVETQPGLAQANGNAPNEQLVSEVGQRSIPESEARPDSGAAMVPPETLPAWSVPVIQSLRQLWSLAEKTDMPADLCRKPRPELPIDSTVQVCTRGMASDWHALADFSRPLLVYLDEPAGSSTILLAVENGSAKLLAGEQVVSVALPILDQVWRGEFAYLWHPPAGFSEPVFLWQESAAVAQIAALFASLDKQTQALAGSTFNRQLDKRVRLFQAQQGLEVDGVVGERTVLKLNEALQIDVSSAQILRQFQLPPEDMVQR